MLLVLLFGPRVYQNVVDEHDHRPIQRGPAHQFHELHERRQCVGESKRHHHKLVMPIKSSEGRLLDILLANSHLMISKPQINIRKPRRLLQLIKQIADPWKWITVLDSQLVHSQ